MAENYRYRAGISLISIIAMITGAVTFFVRLADKNGGSTPLLFSSHIDQSNISLTCKKYICVLYVKDIIDRIEYDHMKQISFSPNKEQKNNMMKNYLVSNDMSDILNRAGITLVFDYHNNGEGVINVNNEAYNNLSNFILFSMKVFYPLNTNPRHIDNSISKFSRGGKPKAFAKRIFVSNSKTSRLVLASLVDKYIKFKINIPVNFYVVNDNYEDPVGVVRKWNILIPREVKITLFVINNISLSL